MPESGGRYRVPRRGKTIVLLLGAAGCVVVLATAYATKDLVRERWHLYRLATGTEEEKLAAIERLGERRSARAVSALIEELRRAEKTSPMKSINYTGDPRHFFGRFGYPVTDALIRIDRPALPAVLICRVGDWRAQP